MEIDAWEIIAIIFFYFFFKWGFRFLIGQLFMQSIDRKLGGLINGKKNTGVGGRRTARGDPYDRDGQEYADTDPQNFA